MKKFLLLFIAGALSAQDIQPTIGVNWTGGLSYDMEQEVPSAKLGVLYTPKTESIIFTNLELSANYYYNFLAEKNTQKNTFYNLKFQANKEFIEWYNFSYYVGYVNDFDNQLMRNYKGDFKTNLSYGFGLQITDDYVVGEIMFEQIAGYPHLSVGVTYKFKSLIK